MCIPSNFNLVFSSKLCTINIKDLDDGTQCDICQFWIHMKCSKLNHTDYKYLQGST